MAHPNVIDTEPELAEIVRSARSVAVIGMKDESDPDAPAHQIPKAVKARGLRVIPVNPKIVSALGEKAFPSVAAIGARVEVVQVFRRSEAIGAIADEILALPMESRPKVVWMQTGIRNDEAAERLAMAGIQVVMDRCLSVYAAKYRPTAAESAGVT
jgi:predicted CoA-binding protein